MISLTRWSWRGNASWERDFESIDQGVGVHTAQPKAVNVRSPDSLWTTLAHPVPPVTGSDTLTADHPRAGGARCDDHTVFAWRHIHTGG
jgi:hypothetical protein